MKSYYTEYDNERMKNYRIEFFETVAPDGCRTYAHVHPAIEILHFTEGGARVTLDGTEYFPVSGDTLVIRSNIVHAIELPQGKSCRYFVAKVHPSLILDVFAGENDAEALAYFILNRPAFLTLLPASRLHDAGCDACLSRMIDEYRADAPHGYSAIRLYIAEFLLTLLRYDGKPRAISDMDYENIRKMYSTLLYIDEHFTEAITPEECAAALPMSYSYFARIFKNVTGKTFKEYLISMRLHRAESTLITTDMPVTDVAADCGYDNVSYFIREFRKAKGVTPLAFRKMNRKNADGINVHC